MNRRVADALGVTAVLLVFAATAAVMAEPWVRDAATSDIPAARYLGLEDGAAQLLALTGEDGAPAGWRSTNVQVLSGLVAVEGLDAKIGAALRSVIAPDAAADTPSSELRDEVEAARVVRTTTRRLDADGVASGDDSISVLTDNGFYLLGFEDPSGPATFEPPLRLFAGAAEPGEQWTAEGQFSGFEYRWSAEMVAVPSADTSVGRLDDCVGVDYELVLERDGTNQTRQYADVYCAGVGFIGGEVHGDQEEISSLVSVTGSIRADAGDLPPPGPRRGVTPDEPGQPDLWAISRLGRTTPALEVGHATIAPTWIGSDPPLVLSAADSNGDLVAMDAGEGGGAVAWRLHTGGSVYGQPAYDDERGRIYVGASDGRLYAVDDRGLFLWSAATGDSVAGQPLLVADTVVVGSEDGHVYGIDPDTGARRWSVRTGGAVASSAAALDGVAAIGSDDGSVRGLDPATGDERWTYAADGAVEAPVVAAGDTFLVATRAGTIAALDPATGEARWEADAGGGEAIRSAPVRLGDLAVVVDLDGDLVAHDLETGDRRWIRRGSGYVGPPAILGDTLAVARETGTVDAVDARGSVIASFALASASLPDDPAPALQLGPTAGGGALWLGDDATVVRRLGAPSETAAPPLEVAWQLATTDDPLPGYPIAYTAVSWRGAALVFDSHGDLIALDPATGDAEIQGTAPAPVALVTEPVVVGDVLVVDLGDRLAAFDLPGFTLRWEQPHELKGGGPPVVEDGVVVHVTGDESGAVVQAVDLDDGTVLWESPTGGMGVFAAGAIAADTTNGPVVLAGSPLGAYDLHTGTLRWQTTAGRTAARPALEPDGRLVIVATIEAEANTGGLAAYDVASGDLAWSVSTGQDTLPVTSGVLVAGAAAVLASTTGELVGYDLGDGSEVWRLAVPSPFAGNGSVIDGRVWIMLQSGQVIAVEPEQGEIVASSAAIEGGALGLVQRPVAVGGRVIITTGSAIVAVAEAQ